MRAIFLGILMVASSVSATPGLARADSKPGDPTKEQMEAAKKAYAQVGGELIPYKHPLTKATYAQFNFDKKTKSLTDEDLKDLPDLPIAFMLDFESCAKVTDNGLKHLKKLKNLHGLGLRGTQVTDAGLKDIKDLPLIDLVLGQTKVTDGGLKELRGLKNLVVLWLHDTNITDAGLKELKELKNLRDLDLSKSKVTKDGVKELQKVLPSCEIRS